MTGPETVLRRGRRPPPKAGETYEYAGFEPAAGFTGQVELLEYREVRGK